MNYKKITKTVNNIFENTPNEKLCIFIDGEWGIGKTYSIKKWAEENKERFDLKYISVFGKDSIKGIEKELVMQLLVLGNKIAKLSEKINKNKTLNILSRLGNDIVQNFTGFELDISKYVENISIESLNSAKDEDSKRTIICIDDLERKGPKIRLVDLMGLIERASINFDIIFIANSKKFNEEIENFHEFKEKVIDYEFKIDSIDTGILTELLNRDISGVDKEISDTIIDNYLSSSDLIIDFKKQTVKTAELHSQYMNLRIYKKYIDLIKRLNIVINQRMDTSGFQLDNKLLKTCKDIIFDYYFPDRKKISKTKANFDRNFIANEISSIFLYEESNLDAIIDYFTDYSEISRDIKKLINAYSLNQDEYDSLLAKIDKNIINKNVEYFCVQSKVISLFDALNDFDMAEKYKEDLLGIAEKMYSPDIDERLKKYDVNDWFQADFCGTAPCSIQTFEFIKAVNARNGKCFDKYISERRENAIIEKDIETLREIIDLIEVEDRETFESLFFVAFDELKGDFDDNAWKFICRLIYRTNSEVFINGHFSNKVSANSNTVEIQRYLKLQEILDEKVYYEEQARCQEESEGN